MAKKSQLVWVVGGAAALAAVGYFFFLRKKETTSLTSGETRSSAPVGTSVKVDVQRGKDYILVVNFADESVMSEVLTDLSSWASNVSKQGSSSDQNGRVYGFTLKGTADRSLYVSYPKRVVTPSSKYYDLLMVKKAGTA